MNTTYIIIIGFVALYLFLYFIPIGLWMQAKVSGLNISLLELVFMKLRKVPPTVIVSLLIESHKAELKVKRVELEALFLSGGNVRNVVHGMIMAKKYSISLTFEEACKVDRKGYNLIEVIEKEVNRK